MTCRIAAALRVETLFAQADAIEAALRIARQRADAKRVDFGSNRAHAVVLIERQGIRSLKKDAKFLYQGDARCYEDGRW